MGAIASSRLGRTQTSNDRDRCRTDAVGVIGNGATFDVASTWGTRPNPPTNNRGSKVHVAVTYDFHSLIPIVPLPAVTIKGESRLVVNN